MKKNITKRLFQPKINDLAALQWSPYKTLGQARGAWIAASYAVHRCHLARHTMDSEWVPLWSQMMAKIAGNAHTWGKVWKLLTASNLLECDGISRHGEKSLSFRLGPTLVQAEWKLSDALFRLPEVSPRDSWKGLSINALSAHSILEDIAPKRGWSRERLEAWHYRVVEFSPEFTVGRTSRLFGDANMFPREVRDALLIHGKPTAEVDISNSQPLFLATYYDRNSSERRKYLELVETGCIYNFFANALGNARDEAKQQFLTFLFGGNEPKFRAIFIKEFPELWTAVKAMRAKHYKALVFDLQEKEARIILDACDKFDGVSIHDGLRVAEDQVKDAAKYVEQKLREIHGLAANVTIG